MSRRIVWSEWIYPIEAWLVFILYSPLLFCHRTFVCLGQSKLDPDVATERKCNSELALTWIRHTHLNRTLVMTGSVFSSWQQNWLMLYVVLYVLTVRSTCLQDVLRLLTKLDMFNMPSACQIDFFSTTSCSCQYRLQTYVIGMCFPRFVFLQIRTFHCLFIFYGVSLWCVLSFGKMNLAKLTRNMNFTFFSPPVFGSKRHLFWERKGSTAGERSKLLEISSCNLEMFFEGFKVDTEIPKDERKSLILYIYCSYCAAIALSTCTSHGCIVEPISY